MTDMNRVAIWLAPTLIALVPVAIGVVYQDVVFSPIGSLDSYMFVGLGLHYNIPTLYASDYKVTRIPWIMVEYWFRHLLSPLAAQYTIQYLVHAALGLGFYFSLRRALGIAPAFLGSIFLLSYTELYSASPADYMNTFAAVLYVLTFWLVSRAAQQRSPYGTYAAAGATFACTVYTNTYFGLFTPMLVGHAIMLRRRAGLSPRVPGSLLSLVAGGASATLLLGTIAFAYGRDFNFIRPELEYILVYIHPDTQWWYRPWPSGWWYRDEGYFGCQLGLAMGAALVALVSRAGKGPLGESASWRVSLSLQYAYAFALFALLQTLGQAILQPNHVMFPLIIPFAMALVALVSIAGSLDHWEPNVAQLLGAWLFMLLPLCWPQVFASVRAPIAALPPFVMSACSMALILAMVAVGRVAIISMSAVYFVALASALSIVNIESASYFSVHNLFRSSPCAYRRDGYLAVLDLDRTVLSAAPPPGEVYIWFDEKETFSLEGCGLVHPSDIAWSFKSLGFSTRLTPRLETKEQLRNIAGSGRNPYVLIASQEPEATANIVDKLDADDVSITRFQSLHIREGALALNFAALRLQRPER